MLLQFLAKLLFHYKGSCLFRCANVYCPSGSAVAIVMHDLDTGVLPSTSIDF